MTFFQYVSLSWLCSLLQDHIGHIWIKKKFLEGWFLTKEFVFSSRNFCFLAAFLFIVDGDFFLASLLIDLVGSWSSLLRLKSNQQESLTSNLQCFMLDISCLEKSRHYANTKFSIIGLLVSDIFYMILR